ncbi:hypothetical protein EJ02DRAFT_503317 [Clathrospora elynae]|uniref:Uncharacterized protein n=1 Tax=Clathrospora elynae TaxID=706981 RepID=A0A6A5SXD0_9PLEO|nr:hypothetical protein EJ02DRAFT_503317 [Clathrospora elynae]
MPKLYYFQAPTFTINLKSATSPKLGSIFSSIPTDLTNQSASTNFSETRAKGFTESVGLNATVAQGIAGTAEVVYAFSRDKKNAYYCELLETLEFEPTREFVKDSIVASQHVQTTLSNALPGRKRVYMITGPKIATGFSTTTTKETQHGPTLKVGVDATAFGVPAEASPEVELGTTNARTVSEGRSLNKIVFAYRVVRIRVKRDGEAKWKHKDGGKYAADDEDSEEDEEPWELDPLDEKEVEKDFPQSVLVEIVNVANFVETH